MSLAEITRNCFQSGVSSGKWISLCKLFISQNPIIIGPEAVANHISNSVLVLYRSYTGDPSLTAYLKWAIKDGILPLSIFVSTFLQAARSSDLHTPATLDVLCELVLKIYGDSATSAIGSLVAYSDSQISILEAVRGALALFRVSHTMQLSHHHQKLLHNSGKLLVDLISCVTDVSQVSVAQAFMQYSEVNDVLQNFQIDAQIRPVLESFAISLGMLIGDDAKVAREAQMMQSMQMAKGDIGGPNSDSDVITLGLLWQYLVTHRAHEFGAGNTPSVVMLLVSTWRWSSWTAQVFYAQVFLSAFTCLASNTTNSLFWKAFVVGRLPHLLAAFHTFMIADYTMNIDWRDAFRQGLRSAFRRPDIIVPGDHLLLQASGSNTLPDGNMHSYTRELLRQLAKVELIDQSLAVELDHSISNESRHNLHTEAQDAGVDLAAYLEMRLTPEIDIADARLWLDRIWKDVGSHSVFANLVIKRFSSFSTAFDVESLSHLCKLLFTHQTALDLVAMHVKVSDLIFNALLFLEEYDCETVGDPQTAVSHLGDVVLFVQYSLTRFQFDQNVFVKDGRSISADFLQHTDEILHVDSLPPAEATSFHSWFKALFDSSSEGIEDTILRSTHPKILLRISATLFSQAIRVASTHKIDVDVLMNGVSYFTGPLLNWTLVGVIKALMNEVQRSRNPAPAHFEILQILLMSPSCPRPVLALCSPPVLRYLSDKAKSGVPSCPSFNVPAVQVIVTEAAVRSAPFHSSYPATSWSQYPRESLQAAISLGQSQKIVDLDVDRCLKVVNPTEFLRMLWSELAVVAFMGELEVCRRVSTFVLTMPRNSKVPPLLPIFMHLVLPSITSSVDNQPTQEQTSNVELLTTIIFSCLTAALHLEWSMATVLMDNRTILGASTSAIARRLAHDLRADKKSQTCSLIMQRLSSSQSFVANFPYFSGELGN